ncbi:hypothetical protein BCR34DRAFT_592028 [Clohesyomyces aquaticus]|uniref:Uncharacterized protein n=1 Tax=Clohesyomyces aquaticus TaxID=1231657 RepID=A0A1Y1YVH4_9PLEO|nr:hypothetical protein BCR34DRAFT_592028 [Clohesyomyces aquaticus]
MASPRSSPTPTSPTISKAHKMSYRIARGEQGVLTFEPYKSAILPLWRFNSWALERASGIPGLRTRGYGNNSGCTPSLNVPKRYGSWQKVTGRSSSSGAWSSKWRRGRLIQDAEGSSK